MRRATDEKKVDLAIFPQTAVYEGGAVYSLYFDLIRYRSADFVVCCGPMDDLSDELTIQVFEAQDMNGTSAQEIASKACSLVCNEEVIGIEIVFGTNGNAPQVGDTVTINGVTFEFAAATSVEDRLFSDYDGLIDCINSHTYGVPHAIASGNTGVYVFSEDPGETVFTAESSNQARIAVTTVASARVVSVDDVELDKAHGMSHIAVAVTAENDNLDVCAIVLREGYRRDQTGLAG